MKLRISGILMVLVMLAMLTGSVSAASPVKAGVTAVPAWLRVGQTTTTTVWIDTQGNTLGSFSANLSFDPTVLKYNSDSGAPPGWMAVINATQAGTGRIIFVGANINGATGRFVPITITFTALKPGYSPLDLSVTALSAAKTFANLLPGATVQDGLVFVRR